MKYPIQGIHTVLRGRSQFAKMAIILFAIISALLIFTNTAHAVPTKMNFQGRLTDNAGNIKPNGTYNMKFRLYDAASSGTLKWSEDRLVSAGNGVTVTNGLFSVQLGSVVPGSLTSQWFQGDLYLEVELPNVGSETSSSPTWGETLSPRSQLATSAYAYNSETLDGLDSSEFAQLDAYNAFTGFNEFYDTTEFYGGVTFDGSTTHYGNISTLNTNASAFKIQNGTGVDVLSVDTSAQRVIIGDGTAGEKLDIIGNWQVRDASTATKSVRVRTSGLDLDFEAAGDKIQFSTWSGADYTGTQYNQMRFNADGTPINVQRAFDLVNAVASDVALKITGAASQSADIFQLKANASSIVMAVNPTGATTLKNSSNSTAAVMIQNAAGNELFQVDTTNSRVYIGDSTADSTGTILVLDTKNTSGDPTGVNGGMYYNSNTNDFRCYVNSSWQSCQAQTVSMSGAVTSGGTTTSSTYANMPAPSSVSITKKGGTSTKLVIQANATLWTSSATSTALIGVNVDSTDYDCGQMSFSATGMIGLRFQTSCSITVSGLSAGSKTIQLRWKRTSGTGTVSSSVTNDWNSMTVSETN
jgi:hypothetical protein